MLDAEIHAILAVARACVWGNRVDLIEGALHETCHHGKAASLAYVSTRIDAAPAAGSSANGRRSVIHAELERAAQTRFKGAERTRPASRGD